MSPPRVPARQLSTHLLTEPPAVRRTVRALRRSVLKAAPDAAEAFKFGVLSYFHAQARFKSIGGNICMIEIKRGRVLLSFIHGALVPDPHRLLFGSGKFKRFASVPSPAVAASRPIAALVRSAARLRPWK